MIFFKRYFLCKFRLCIYWSQHLNFNVILWLSVSGVSRMFRLQSFALMIIPLNFVCRIGVAAVQISVLHVSPRMSGMTSISVSIANLSKRFSKN